MVDIEISVETFAQLDKYCNDRVRPADMTAVLGRILEGWYSRAAKEWLKNPWLIPKEVMRPIGERRTQRVAMRSEDARAYLRTLNELVRKLDERAVEARIDPCSLADWLCRLFIRMHGIVEKNKYRVRMGRLKKI